MSLKLIGYQVGHGEPVAWNPDVVEDAEEARRLALEEDRGVLRPVLAGSAVPAAHEPALADVLDRVLDELGVVR